MKGIVYLILLILAAATASAQQTNTTKADTAKTKPVRQDLLRKIPEPLGWVNDYEMLFTTDQVRQLDSLIRLYEKQTTREIAVLTIEASRTSQRDFDEFTMLIGNVWGIGKEETHNGILIAISAQLRRMRIHNGFGIEKVLSNEKTKEIMDTVFFPYYKEGKYFEGTMQGILALIQALPQN